MDWIGALTVKWSDFEDCVNDSLQHAEKHKISIIGCIVDLIVSEIRTNSSSTNGISLQCYPLSFLQLKGNYWKLNAKQYQQISKLVAKEHN